MGSAPAAWRRTASSEANVNWSAGGRWTNPQRVHWCTSRWSKRPGEQGRGLILRSTSAYSW